MSNVFFTSDLHFSHANIARYCPQFRLCGVSVGEADDWLVARWNACVSPDDTVYNLGDVSFGGSVGRIAAVLGRLNGRHHLILGNHDTLISERRDDFLCAVKHDGHPLLSSVQHYLETDIPQLGKTVLFHYPIAEWNGRREGSCHLYGHLHSRTADISGRALNVCWDTCGRLLTAQDVAACLESAAGSCGANGADAV